jgi:hypothetical protein
MWFHLLLGLHISIELYIAVTNKETKGKKKAIEIIARTNQKQSYIISKI